MNSAEGAFRRRWGFLAVLGMMLLFGVGADIILASKLSTPKPVEVGVSRPCTPASMTDSLAQARDAVGAATQDGINPGGRLAGHLEQADGHLFDALTQAKDPC